MAIAYIALGSNLDEPIQQLQTAVQSIKQHSDMLWLAGSWVYESAPIGPQDQDNFYNACIAIDTCLTPEQLLSALQAIELQQQRQRFRHWGPRTLDLDIVDFVGQCRDDERLIIPHAYADQRLFVLLPMQDIAPQWQLKQRALSYWVAACKDQMITKTSISLA